MVLITPATEKDMGQIAICCQRRVYRSPLRCLVKVLAAIAVLYTESVAQAQEWPRFHVGVAAGNPQWSVNIAETGVPLPDPIVGPNRSAEPGTGWKWAAGYRPLRGVGVEIQYVDLGDGETSVHGGSGALGGGQLPTIFRHSNSVKASVDARVLTALLFIPLDIPSLDVYGKIGVADLKESLSASTTIFPPGPVTPECVPYYRCFTTVNTHIAESESASYVGIGVRVKFAARWAVRAEYEAIDRDDGDPTTLLSLGVSWER